MTSNINDISQLATTSFKVCLSSDPHKIQVRLLSEPLQNLSLNPELVIIFTNDFEWKMEERGIKSKPYVKQDKLHTHTHTLRKKKAKPLLIMQQHHERSSCNLLKYQKTVLGPQGLIDACLSSRYIASLCWCARIRTLKGKSPLPPP